MNPLIKEEIFKKKPSNLSSRIKTAAVALPTLFFMIYFQFLYFILALIVIYISHSEFHDIQSKILNKVFTDYYAELTWMTMMSSPLPSFIFLLCPTILYFSRNCEILACLIPLSILVVYRINKFILIYRVLNTNESSFNITPEKDVDGSPVIQKERVPNPIKTAIQKENPEGIKMDKDDIPSPFTFDRTKKSGRVFGFFKNLKDNLKENLSQNIIPNLINAKRAEKSKTENLSNQYISSRMFNSSLVIIMLDLLFFFIYALPVALAISVHNSEHGFIYLFLTVVVAYLCDSGALIAGKLFGRNPFGNPVTPGKTKEGVYGGIILGFISSYLFRYSVQYFIGIIIMDHFFIFFMFTIFSLFAAIFGDFFESFLKRCADVKDSGCLLPGHGGLLDRIDSITLVVYVVYYFMS